MRVVIDTNVWVSGLLWKGPAWALLRLAEAGRVQICAMPPMLAELSEVLGHARFRSRLAQLALTPGDLLHYALGLTTIFEAEDAGTRPLVAADPDDDMFPQAAVAARAAYVISGDAHLLTLGEYAGIPIVSLRAFLEREFPER